MISVVIPEVDATTDVAMMVQIARRHAHVGEVIVLNDGIATGLWNSRRELGVQLRAPLVLGRGAAMHQGMRAALGDIVLYLVGNLDGLDHDFMDRMISPIECGWADFVKAKSSSAGDRITTTMLRPLMATLFPEIASFEDPLSGIVGARRSLLAGLPFEINHGVDVGLLIDAAMSDARLAEAEIGEQEQNPLPWEMVPDFSSQVMRAILSRANKYGRLSTSLACGLQKLQGRLSTELPLALEGPPEPTGLAVFTVDGVLVRDEYFRYLAHCTGLEQQLAAILNDPTVPDDEKTPRIGSLFQNTPREVLEGAASEIPLTAGARQAVWELRRAGYRVGVMSTAFPEAADILRQRVCADFAAGCPLGWIGSTAAEVASSSETSAPASACCGRKSCLRPMLLALCERFAVSPEQVVVVASGERDLCLLKVAGVPVAFEPMTNAVHQAAKYVIRGDLSEVPVVVRKICPR